MCLTCKSLCALNIDIDMGGYNESNTNRNKQERRRKRGESEELFSSNSAGEATTRLAHMIVRHVHLHFTMLNTIL